MRAGFAREKFHLPPDIIYLDGNSLGPLPVKAHQKMQQVLYDEWGKLLISAWNDASWIDLPLQLGERIAPIIGAPKGSVITGDTLSLKLYQALFSALKMRSERRVVLTDTGNFPSDIYMAEGLLRMLGGYELKIMAPEEIEASIDETVAVVMLTHVDYRSGAIYDMSAITSLAHSKGAVMLWDLAHSVGAVPISLGASEFAVGCTYKYLNGGPGSPAFIYVRPDLLPKIDHALCGWLGSQAPFDFAQNYVAASTVESLRIGTPPIIQMRVLEAALEIWSGMDLEALRQQSIELSESFIQGLESECPELLLLSPRDPNRRGSHVSYVFEDAYALVQALIDHGVIGDFRAPNIARFGFAPLYVSLAEVNKAVVVIAEILKNEKWREPKYQKRKAVT